MNKSFSELNQESLSKIKNIWGKGRGSKVLIVILALLLWPLTLIVLSGFVYNYYKSKNLTFAKLAVVGFLLLTLPVTLGWANGVSGVFTGSKTNNEKQAKSSQPVPTSFSEPTPTSAPITTPKEIPYQTSEPYEVGSETWESIIISSNASKEEVIALAKKLHREHSDTHYNIFDDRKELDSWIKWEKSKNDPAVYFPEEWDKDHYVGMINKMLTKNGLKWQFTADKDKYLGTVDLESESLEPTATVTPTVTSKTQLTPQPTQVPVKEPTWVKIKFWQGTGTKNTEQFTITGSQWRVNYTLTGHPDFGAILQIYVYKPDGSLVGLPVNTVTAGNDTSYLYQKGTFYLTINGAAEWIVEIEELK